MRKRQHRVRSYRNKRRKNKFKKYILLFSLTFILVIAFMVGGNEFLSNSNSTENAPPAISVDLEQLNSPYAILIDLDSQKVLGKHNEQEKIYPASLTKIMTALIAIENIDNMDEKITLPKAFSQKFYKKNASMAGFKPGERIHMKDLIYGILLPSGAECCVTIADRIAGSEDAFVDLMNQKAKDFGMKNTHFRNTTGLHDSDHYSTVKDISILLEKALMNNKFREVFTSSQYRTSSSDQHPDGIKLHSTMFKLMDSTEVTGGEIIGGKTGYTTEAGLCLASLARVEEKEFILITAKAEGESKKEPYHILDAKDVYNKIGNQLIGY